MAKRGRPPTKKKTVNTSVKVTAEAPKTAPAKAPKAKPIETKKSFEIFTEPDTVIDPEVETVGHIPVEPIEPIEQVESIAVEQGFALYDDSPLTFDLNDPHARPPEHVAAELLGVVGLKRYSKCFKRISAIEFHYYEHGLSLRFLKDNPADTDNKLWIVVVGQETRRICNTAAYWLIDKLSAETGERLFFCPGREGVRR